MAGTVETDLALFVGATTGASDGDDLDDWSGGSLVVDTESKIQGTGCMSDKISNTLVTFSFACASTNVTDKAIYAWLMCITPTIDSQANGGFRIGIGDGTYTGDWYVGGSGNYAGGWQCFGVHTGETVDTGNNSVSRSAVTAVRIGFKTTAASAKDNCFIDAIRYGSYLRIRGGTEGDPGDFQDMLTADTTYAYGVFKQTSGVIFAQIPLHFGSTGAGEDTYFEDTTAPIIVFKDGLFPSSYYEILLQGNSTGDIQIYFGESVGGQGVNGPVVKAESSSIPFAIDASDTNIDYYGFYGCSLYYPSTITLQAYSANKEFLSCNIIAGAEMLPGTAFVESCNFISAPSRAVRLSSASHNTALCNFINCQTAVHHDVGAASGAPLEYDYDTLMFYGSTYDIENSATTPDYYIDIDRLNGSNPDSEKINNSGGGTTTLLDITVTLTLTGLVSGSEVRIYDAGTIDELDGIESSDTSFAYQYAYVADTYIDIVVHKEDYIYYRVSNYLLGLSDASLPIQQQTDRQYDNP